MSIWTNYIYCPKCGHYYKDNGSTMQRCPGCNKWFKRSNAMKTAEKESLGGEMKITIEVNKCSECPHYELARDMGVSYDYCKKMMTMIPNKDTIPFFCSIRDELSKPSLREQGPST